MKVLVLGGTAEARRLVRALAAWPEAEVTVSLAGHTTEVADHGTSLRTGGFGGAAGLTTYLRDQAVDVVVDATHPFAATMPLNALVACEQAGLPRLRLVRPPWTPGPRDRWTSVDDLPGAAEAVGRSGAGRVLLTTGRLELAPFADIAGVAFVLRTIEDPGPLPFPAEVVLARGPFSVDDEVDLLTTAGIDLLVTKNAGGSDAKLVAARRLGVPAVVVRRPAPVPGSTVASTVDALAWLRQVGLGHPRRDRRSSLLPPAGQ